MIESIKWKVIVWVINSIDTILMFLSLYVGLTFGKSKYSIFIIAQKIYSIAC